MKNPKILPFGDWFRVYESVDRNYQKSQRILESRMYKGLNRIFEDNKQGESPAAGASIKLPTQYGKFAEYLANAKKLISEKSSDNGIKGAIKEINKMLRTDDSPFSLNFLGNNMTADNILAHLIATRAGFQYDGEDKRADRKPWTVKELIGQLVSGQFAITLQRNADYDIKLTPVEGQSKDTGLMIYTKGKISDDAAMTVENEGDDSQTSYTKLKHYINQHNIISTFTQGYRYDSDSIENGYFNLEETPTTIDNDGLIVYLDSFTEGGKVERKDTEIENEIGAQNAEIGTADIKFQQATLEKGGANILPSEDPKIQKLADIIESKFKDKTVAEFELTSSASPEYGAIKNVTGWESSYANTKTTGEGDPGAGTDDASNNVKLAYERGVSFMKALNVKLNAMGHPGFAKYKVKWQIAAAGGPANDGRFVDIMLKTNEVKPVIIKTTDVNGKELVKTKKTSGKETATLYYFKLAMQ